MYMKKQSQLLMYTGIMAGVIITSCKSSDSVVVYDDQAQPKVYRATKSDVAAGETGKTYAHSVQNGKVVSRTITNTIVKSPDQPVYQAKAQNNTCPMIVETVQNYPDNPPAGQYIPQVIDMTTRNNGQGSVYNYNQSVEAVNPNYGTYPSAQVYNTQRVTRSNQRTSGRNKSLDHNLYNRPTAYTLTDDMYTPEYRSMMYNRQNRSSYNQQSVQNAPNNPYDGLMTIENGNVVAYNSQPRIIQQQQYTLQQQYQEPQPQQYVVPVEPQPQYYYPQAQTNVPNTSAYVYSQNEVAQAEANYPATLYFKNGAKLTGTLVEIDNSACMFKMAEGRLVNFSTKDILKIERR